MSRYHGETVNIFWCASIFVVNLEAGLLSKNVDGVGNVDGFRSEKFWDNTVEH